MDQRTPGAYRDYSAALIIFAVCAFALALPWVSGHVTIPWDAKAHFYPQLVFLSKTLHSGESPFWNPYVFAGSVHIADPQSLIFTLPYLLVAKFIRDPGFIAADATILGMISLGGLALMLFFRDRGWHPAGALLAGLSFAFGGSAAWRIQHIGEVLSLAFFAITLLFLSRIFLRGGWWNGLLAGFFGGLMLIGRDQIALLCALILLIYALWNLFVTPWRVSLVPLAMALVAGLVTIAVPISLTLVLAEQSTRTDIDFEGAARGSLHPAALLTAFVANLFGTDGPLQNFWGPPQVEVWGGNYNLARNMANVYFGALPLVAFLGLGILAGRVFRRDMAPLVISFILILLYALGDFTPFYKAVFNVPGLDLFRRPADATFPLCALASILAGYSLHRFITDDDKSFLRNAFLPALVVVAGLAATIAVAWWKNRLVQAQIPLLIGGGFLTLALVVLFLLRRFNRRIGPAALLLVAGALTLDLAVSNGPNESTALPPSRFEMMRTDTANETIALLRRKLGETAGPDRIDRVELAAVGFDWPNLGLIHGFQHDLGYNPVRLSWFVDATAAQDQVAVVEQRPFAPLFSSYRSLMADMLGVRFIASAFPIERIDPDLKSGDLNFIARTKDAYVYENPRALPRVMVARQARKVDFDALAETGEWLAGFDPRETVLLDSADAEDAKPRRPASARIDAYQNTQVRISVNAPDGGYLVLNDVWHPWWRVEVAGQRSDVLRANAIFRAVKLPPGAHQVRFYFAPLRGLRLTLRAAVHSFLTR